MNTVIIFLSKYGLYGVLTAAFFEAIIFPPPVDIFLIPVLMANRDKAILYSILTVIVSMLGAAVGYNLGKALGRPLLDKMFKAERIDSVKRVYDKYGALAIITSAFTPIPYEAYVLSAGLFKMDFYKFFGAAFAGRILRYVPQGIVIQLLGQVLENNKIIGIGLVIILSTAALVVLIVVKRRISKRRKA